MLPEAVAAVDAHLRAILATPGINLLIEAYYKIDGPFAGRTFDGLGVNPPGEITRDDLLAVSMLDVR